MLCSRVAVAAASHVAAQRALSGANSAVAAAQLLGVQGGAERGAAIDRGESASSSTPVVPSHSCSTARTLPVDICNNSNNSCARWRLTGAAGLVGIRCSAWSAGITLRWSIRPDRFCHCSTGRALWAELDRVALCRLAAPGQRLVVEFRLERFPVRCVRTTAAATAGSVANARVLRTAVPVPVTGAAAAAQLLDTPDTASLSASSGSLLSSSHSCIASSLSPSSASVSHPSISPVSGSSGSSTTFSASFSAASRSHLLEDMWACRPM